MIKKQTTFFAIANLTLAGGILSIFFGMFAPRIISRLSSIDLQEKIAVVLIILLYVIFATVTVIANYLLLVEERPNRFMTILVIMFCLSIGINTFNFKFLPFSVDFNLRFNFTGLSLRFGVNLIGIFFLVWLNWLKYIYSSSLPSNKS